MATQLYTIPDSEISLKYRQPYVSEALNRKNSVIPRGIVRGAIPSPSSINNTLTFKVDGISKDTVINCAGRSASSHGSYFLTWRTTDNFNLTFPNDGGLYFVVVEAGYILGQATAPKILSYTEAEFESGSCDNGVLLCVVKAKSLPTVFTEIDYLFGGLSTTLRKPFVRDYAELNNGDKAPLNDLVPVYHCQFNPYKDQGKIKRLLVENDYTLGYRSDVVLDTSSETEDYLYRLKTTALIAVNSAGVVGFEGSKVFLPSNSTSGETTVRLLVSARYKTENFGLSGTDDPYLGLKITWDDETELIIGDSAIATPSYVTNYIAPSSGGEILISNSSFTWLMYEVAVDISQKRIASIQPYFDLGNDTDNNCQIDFDRITIYQHRPHSEYPSTPIGHAPNSSHISKGDDLSELTIGNTSRGVSDSQGATIRSTQEGLQVVPLVQSNNNFLTIGSVGYSDNPYHTAETGRYMSLLVTGDSTGNQALATNGADLIVRGNTNITTTSGGYGGDLSVVNGQLTIASHVNLNNSLSMSRFFGVASLFQVSNVLSFSDSRGPHIYGTSSAGAKATASLAELYSSSSVDGAVELSNGSDQFRLYLADNSYPSDATVAISLTLTKVFRDGSSPNVAQNIQLTGAQINGLTHKDVIFSTFNTPSLRSLNDEVDFLLEVFLLTDSGSTPSPLLYGIRVKTQHSKIVAN